MPYNPKSVLRQVPNGILQKYFARYDEFAASLARLFRMREPEALRTTGRLLEWIHDSKPGINYPARQVFRIKRVHSAVEACANNHRVPKGKPLIYVQRLRVIHNLRRGKDQRQYIHEFT